MTQGRTPRNPLGLQGEADGSGKRPVKGAQQPPKKGAFFIFVGGFVSMKFEELN